MTAIPVTTVDLLLNLGIKVADALAKAQGGRVSPNERQAIQALQEWHVKTTEAYKQIRAFLETYRQVWDRALVEGKLGDLYDLCTQAGYIQQTQLIESYNAQQIIQPFVHSSDLLDIRLSSETRNTVSLIGMTSTAFDSAEAYIYSDQTQRYRDGRDIRVSTLQVCRLVAVHHAWKLDAVDSLCTEYLTQ